MSREVYLVATAAVSPFGLGAAALCAGLRGEVAASASTLLAASHPGARAIGVAAVPAAHDPVPAKARKTMSRAAYLGAIALRALVEAGGWRQRDGVGYFLGVGASGGSMADLEAILAATLGGGDRGDDGGRDGHDGGDGGFDLRRFGEAGIPACNPLLAFQLMNNFTMCHGAILEGTTGPSGAFFSRGAGTVAALVEAREAIAAGDCERAIAGGADSALHPVTWVEHQRLADAPVRLPASEGAALLALAAAPGDGAAIVVEAAEQVTRADDPAARAARLVRTADGGCDVVVVGADDPGQRDALMAAICGSGAGSRSEALTLDAVGSCLAATPALGWVAALERLRAGGRRAAVVTLDGAGDLAVVVFARRDGGGA
ncbi:MAG TPA: beta-ketoacyl synthase N-terminal-like domain-containing protein [Kofleriaceae bacterium]|nr:beta-ketoacyl synthase N-terminal-like domain-containing protein [Kofleriaceae bacterium]